MCTSSTRMKRLAQHSCLLAAPGPGGLLFSFLPPALVEASLREQSGPRSATSSAAGAVSERPTEQLLAQDIAADGRQATTSDVEQDVDPQEAAEDLDLQEHGPQAAHAAAHSAGAETAAAASSRATRDETGRHQDHVAPPASQPSDVKTTKLRSRKGVAASSSLVQQLHKHFFKEQQRTNEGDKTSGGPGQHEIERLIEKVVETEEAAVMKSNRGDERERQASASQPRIEDGHQHPLGQLLTTTSLIFLEKKSVDSMSWLQYFGLIALAGCLGGCCHGIYIGHKQANQVALSAAVLTPDRTTPMPISTSAKEFFGRGGFQISDHTSSRESSGGSSSSKSQYLDRSSTSSEMGGSVAGHNENDVAGSELGSGSGRSGVGSERGR
ncbi:unnamed protein product [Amoebophrya sp. A120]|nr:unnamed protein product [Amoebophrya sp. A120]|eukprot:GSA120T00007221001.1